MSKVISLSRAARSARASRVGDDPAEPGRREFLIRCCQGASAALAPAGLRALRFPFAYSRDSREASSLDSQFHLHPNYRAQLPLEATLFKTQAGLDKFVSETYQDQIAAILAEWRSSFLGSPGDVRAIERILSSDFWGPHSGRLRRGSCDLDRRSRSVTTHLRMRLLSGETPSVESWDPPWVRFRRY